MLRVLAFGAVMLAGCSRKPAAAEAPASTTRGEIAGLSYLEQMTGGAQPDERVPMIVVLHPMGGDPADMMPMFQRYHRRARLIFAYGHPRGGKYLWYDSVRDDVAASVVTQEADRIAAGLEALVAAKPTIGKPIITGFSQGAIMTFALAVTHPESMSAAFPVSGLLAPSIYPSAAISSRPQPSTLPRVTAFHGASDLAVPTPSARTSIAELRRAGYPAELHEYAGVEHDVSDQENNDLIEQIGRSAEGR